MVDQLMPARPRCIVLIDDRDNELTLLALDEAGFRGEVCVHDSAQAVLDSFGSIPPAVDLVLVSDHLPGMNGDGLIERLAARGSAPATPVVLLTARTPSGEPWPQAPHAVHAIHAILTKPVQVEALRRVLDELPARTT